MFGKNPAHRDLIEEERRRLFKRDLDRGVVWGLHAGEVRRGAGRVSVGPLDQLEVRQDPAAAGGGDGRLEEGRIRPDDVRRGKRLAVVPGDSLPEFEGVDKTVF